MTSPSGWVEPGQTPEFDEFTLVLRGTLRVETRAGTLEVQAGQAVVASGGRVGALQHAPRGRRGVRGRVRAGVLARHRPSRRGLRARRPGPRFRPGPLATSTSRTAGLARKPSRRAASSTPRAILSMSTAAAEKARARAASSPRRRCSRPRTRRDFQRLERRGEGVERCERPCEPVGGLAASRARG